MLTIFRRAIFSTPGKIVALLMLVALGVGFAMTDIKNLGMGGAPASGALVQIGDQKVTSQELEDRLKNALDRVRQQQPTIDMAQFVRTGGFDQVLDQIVNGIALEEFARQQGMTVAPATVDGQIASIPIFQGFDGKFNQQRFDEFLRAQRMTAEQVRADVRRQLLVQWLVEPIASPGPVPTDLALPYASLQLERRQGLVGFIPAAAIAPGTAPTDAEVQAHYKQNAARYTLPERRVMRYAEVTPARFEAASQPTDAEIAAEYQRNAAQYAPSTRRTLSQIIAADEKTAQAIAAKVKGGTSMADAARSAGLQPSTVKDVEKASFARTANPAIADAAFAAGQGSVIGPIRAPLGWTIVRVDAIVQNAGKSLEQARGELAEAIRKRKLETALTELHGRIDAGIGDNSTFDELVAEAKLKPETTAPLFSDGRAGTDAATAPTPLLAALAQAGFGMESSDNPQIIPIGTDGSFALVKTDRVIAAAPRPLAEIRDTVTQDLVRSRQLAGARTAAAAALAKIGKGTPIATALRETGLSLPPVQPLDATRAQLAQMGAQLPPPVRMIFSMAAKKAKMVPAPDGTGYWIVWLDAIQPGDAKGNAPLVAQVRSGLGQMIGDEYAAQFAAAARKAVNVKRNEAAIAALKAQLSGAATGGN